LQEAGAETYIISPQSKTVKGWDHVDWGDEFEVDKKLDEADPDEYDPSHDLLSLSANRLEKCRRYLGR
jgi:hypothetical protein